MYIEQVVSEDIYSWRPKDIVKLQAPTGSGKTTFVLTALRRVAKANNTNILYLYNRRILGEQMKQILGAEIGWDGSDEELYELRDYDCITICSYQYLQAILYNQGDFDTHNFAYIVLDEVHYILRDAQFQPEIFYLLSWLQWHMEVSRCIWLFVSATLELTWQFLCEENSTISRLMSTFADIEGLRPGATILHFQPPLGIADYYPRRLWEYYIPADYTWYETVFFENLESLIPKIVDARTGKWLVFVSNKRIGKEFAEKLRVSLKTELVRYLDSDIVKTGGEIRKEIATNQRFEGKVLITTSVLDNGISLWDPDLTNIVMSTFSRDDFIQMIGRKRRADGEWVKLYLPFKDLRSVTGEWYWKCIQALKYARYNEWQIRSELLKDEIFYQFARRYYCFDSKSNMYTINPAGIFMLRYMERFTAYLRENLAEDRYFFAKEQLEWLGKEPVIELDRCIEFSMKKRAIENLCVFLDSIKNQLLDGEKQKELKEVISSCIPIPGKWSTFGSNRINKVLKEANIPYFVCSSYQHRQTFWQVKEVRDAI